MRDFLLACLAAVVLVGGLALGAVLGLVAGAIVIGLAVVLGLGLLAWSLVRAARPRPH
jgi:hypothetical protein